MEVGVLFAWDVSIREGILEYDSKIVLDALLSLCTPPIIIPNILGGVYHQLQNFSVVQVSYVRCQDNQLAYILAKHAKDIVNSDNFVTWIEENSLLTKSAITYDVLNLSSS